MPAEDLTIRMIFCSKGEYREYKGYRVKQVLKESKVYRVLKV